MYAAYLRKSRADLELEKTSGLNTLQRHRDIIINTAKYMNINIDFWYEEVVSGETIEARPKIQEMLLKVEQGFFEGVFVVDVDRLARGDTADQSRISKAFAFSSTKIITPNKIYDPNNDADEEYFEFGLFMSRREYKIINKRLNRGRLASVNEGKFVGSVCPYGYTKEKLKNQKGYKLIKDKNESKIVEIIFELACNDIKSSNIANHLNKIGSKPRKSEVWVSSSIRSILENPVYYGMIKWNYRKTEKKMVNGIVCKSRPKHDEYILVKGLHEPIISKEIYDLANKNSKNKMGKSVKKDLTIQNPLAGLVSCGICGRNMQRRNYRSGHIDGLICPLPHCKNVGSHLYLVENALLKSISDILKEYNKMVIDYQKNQNIITHDDSSKKIIIKEIEKTETQLNKIFDFLEQGIYDNDTFLKRSTILKDKLNSLYSELEKYSVETKANKIEKIINIIPNLENIIKNYSTSISAKERNDLLKIVINKVIYIKTARGRGHEDEFTLKLDIKL